MGLPLITKAEYKDYLNITSINRDNEIEFLIPKVSELVKTYCRRTFIDYYNFPKVEIHNGGYGEIILAESPLYDIIDFSLSTDYGQTYDTTLEQYVDWVQDDYKIIPIKEAYFSYYLRGYRVEYLAGYDGVPDDLKLAVMDIVEYYMKNNGAVHVNRDVTPNVTQIQYVATTNFPAHIKRVLDQYVADYT